MSVNAIMPHTTSEEELIKLIKDNGYLSDGQAICFKKLKDVNCDVSNNVALSKIVKEYRSDSHTFAKEMASHLFDGFCTWKDKIVSLPSFVTN
nr:hypothetical protein [uncultured Deefgea sp.]